MLATMAVNPSDGTLALLANTPSGGNMPWTMTWADAAGEYLLVQNQHAKWDGPDGGENDGSNGSGDGGITVFARDVQTGTLAAPMVGLKLPQCMAVTVLELPVAAASL